MILVNWYILILVIDGKTGTKVLKAQPLFYKYFKKKGIKKTVELEKVICLTIIKQYKIIIFRNQQTVQSYVMHIKIVICQMKIVNFKDLNIAIFMLNMNILSYLMLFYLFCCLYYF